MGVFRRLMLFVCILVAACSVGGVYAYWEYWKPVDPKNDKGLIGLTGFYYKSEEVLPDDGAHDMNALGFVEYVIYNTKAGLNSKKGNAIFSQVKTNAQQQLHSKDTINKSNFNHIFSDTNSQALEFTLQYVSDTKLYLYVYMDEDLAEAERKIEEAEYRGEDLTVRITTYITVIERSKNGTLDWDDKGSAKGVARAVDDGTFYTIDPDTWMSAESAGVAV